MLILQAHTFRMFSLIATRGYYGQAFQPQIPI
jgi:hypothetical protein